MQSNAPKKFSLRRLLHLLVLAVVLSSLAGSLSACRGETQATSASTHAGLEMASMEGMPQEVRDAPVITQDAYRFAAANPEILKELPCYCGCGDMGHTSNYACYISGENSDGNLAYDGHALGCSICVDITQDAMRMLKQGKELTEIRQYVDSTYAQYGPSNMEP